MGDARLDFNVLGPLLLTVDGRATSLGAPKQRALCAALLLSRNRPVAVDTLITACWDQTPAPAVRTSLHSYVSNLRRIFGAGGGPQRVLVSAPPGYQINVADDACDVGRFVAGKIAGVQAAANGRFDDAARHLSAALAQWRGPVLEDLRNFAFVDPFATALTEDRLVVATAHAEAEIACGRASAVIGGLEALAAEHPYREPLWAQLITAYYVSDRQTDALNTYRRLQTSLADDLGIDPSPALAALQARILRQEHLDLNRSTRATAVHTMNQLGDGIMPVRSAQLRGNGNQVYPLHTTVIRIGRHSDNDIVLDDAEVSRHHAVIVDSGSGFTVVDLRSANGVHVGSERIRAGTALSDGDRIRIGRQEFVFEHTHHR